MRPHSPPCRQVLGGDRDDVHFRAMLNSRIREVAMPKIHHCVCRVSGRLASDPQAMQKAKRITAATAAPRITPPSQPILFAVSMSMFVTERRVEGSNSPTPNRCNPAGIQN